MMQLRHSDVLTFVLNLPGMPARRRLSILMRLSVLLLGLAMAATGCRAFERPGTDRPPADPAAPGGIASRIKDRPKDRPPPANGHWLDGPAGTPTSGTDRPPSPGTSDGVRPVGDIQSDVKGVLAGYVVDPDGRKLPDVFIQVQPTDRSGSGAPVGVQTIEGGYFQIKGLQEGRSYTLTAKVRRDGMTLAGQAIATPPYVYVRLPLIEGLELPDGPPAAGAGLDRPLSPASGAAIPPAEVPPRPEPAPLSRDRAPPPLSNDPTKPDGAWSPTGPGLTRPPEPPPTTPPPSRPDLFTPGPFPDWKPPTATIPGSATPSVLPATPPRAPGQTQSRTVRPKPDFVLVDNLGRIREFPSGRADELILIDFMTTTCLPCKKAVPTLKEFQSRYSARGLEVIGVVCDETDTPQRRAFATRYSEQYQLNYLLYVEPGPRPGQVMERFGVEYFPTLVLIDGTGAVRWKGDSRDLGKLDSVIRSNLPR